MFKIRFVNQALNLVFLAEIIVRLIIDFFKVKVLFCILTKEPI